MTFFDSGQSGSVAVVGTGRLAGTLHALLASRGCPVLAVSGRSPGAACQAGRVLIAVSDGAIASVAAGLAAGGLRGAVVLHTSGAAGPAALDALRAAGNSTGVLHPLQTVPSPEAGIRSLPGSTFAYAGDAPAAEWALAVIAALDGRPLAIEASRWALYHAAAVMACNYQAALAAAALELMQSAGIEPAEALAALAPLIRTTTDNLLAHGPARALTGPIRRGDAGTVRCHMAALRAVSPETLRLYSAAGFRTLALAGLAPETAEPIADALRLAPQP